MRIQYIGPHDAVEVVDADIVAERDKPVEIEDAVALRLLEQRGSWTKATAKADTKGGI